MAEKMKSGTILITENAVLPKTIQLDAEPFVPGWKLVKNFGRDRLDEEIRRAGWTFFFFAGEISSTVFGNDGAATVCRAVKRILANPKLEKFNSLEVTRVIPKHFLGLPYTKVCACSRHVWKSMFLFQDENLQQGRHKEAGRGWNERTGGRSADGDRSREKRSRRLGSSAPEQFESVPALMAGAGEKRDFGEF